MSTMDDVKKDEFPNPVWWGINDINCWGINDIKLNKDDIIDFNFSV